MNSTTSIPQPLSSASSSVDRVEVASRPAPTPIELRPAVATAVTGGVRIMVRLENLALLVALLLAYRQLGSGWGLFATLFLVPDLAMLPYLRSPFAGAVAYNAAHTYVAPALVLGISTIAHSPTMLAVATIWAAHIAFDRVVGYGLKYATGFSDTHLGRVGRAAVVR